MITTPTEPGSSPKIQVASAETDHDPGSTVRKEFVPSYEWQDVRPWQSVPAGLEIALVLGDASQRRARIPPVWRLRVYVEPVNHHGGSAVRGKGSGFYFRMDVRRDLTVIEIRRSVAEHPLVGCPFEAVKLLLGGKVLEGHDTVESLDLFSRVRELVVELGGMSGPTG